MNLNGNASTSFTNVDYISNVDALVQRINGILMKYSDKDWNYSRIRLMVVHVTDSESPYLLACELIDMETPQGERALKDVRNEVTWGDHHSNELGILELISLRMNKALLELVGHNHYVSGDSSRKQHPVIRLAKRQDLLAANVSTAMWYDVKEISGEDFENR